MLLVNNTYKLRISAGKWHGCTRGLQMQCVHTGSKWKDHNRSQSIVKMSKRQTL
uniref:Uncharacterized protein n=1 Tax=Arundo donax TaxID=35708 RepID=A0A0A9GTJ6_ARUDO